MDECVRYLRDLHEGLITLAPERTHAIEQMVSEATRAGSRVILFVTPAHPTLMRALDASPAIRANDARAFRFLDSLKARFGITVLDFERIDSYQGNPSDWYDCVHVRDAEAGRLISALVRNGL